MWNDAMDNLEQLISQLDGRRLPQHVAVIMDGNGRWAKQRNLPRSQGHAEGVNTVREITRVASDIGIRYLTLYTFSTENWNRPKDEVDTLMNLIAMALERETPELIANNCSLQMIGDEDSLPEFARMKLRQCVEATAGGTGMKLILAISYSARWEITAALRKLAAEVATGNLAAADITEEHIARRLTTARYPDPDLLIRTGGELRISNFLLWQIAYAELYFTPLYWPDFTKADFVKAIIDYQQRQRRYGKTGDQIIAGDAHTPQSSTL